MHDHNPGFRSRSLTLLAAAVWTIGLVACGGGRRSGYYAPLDASNDSHTGDGMASLGDANASPDSQTPYTGHYYMFVTSLTYDGKLTGSGGLAAGDAECTRLGRAIDKQGLANSKWVAWLSADATASTSNSAISRVQDVVGGWYLLDDTQVFASRDQMKTHPSRVINLTDTQARLKTDASETIWTGTLADGTLAPGNATCTNWTASTGASAVGATIVPEMATTDGLWTKATAANGVLVCTLQGRLYCIQQP